MVSFRNWDENQDGSITEDELKQVLIKLDLKEDAIHKIFLAADSNKDGVINYMEFVQWLFGDGCWELPAGSENKLWFDDTIAQVLTKATQAKVEDVTNLIARDKIVDANSHDAKGTTVLMASAKSGKLDMVKAVLGMSCKTHNAIDDLGMTALDYAVAAKNNGLITWMQDTYMESDNTLTPFVRGLLPAVDRGDAASVRQAVAPVIHFTIKVVQTEDKSHGMHLEPTADGSALRVKAILPGGLVMEWNGSHPLLLVKVGDRLNAIETRKGNVTGVETLQKELGTLDCVKKNPGDPPVIKEGALHLTLKLTFQRDRPGVRFDPNMKNAHGDPAIKVAAHKSAACVKAMLDVEGLNINAPGSHGRLALDSAQEAGLDEETIALMTAKGAKKSA